MMVWWWWLDDDGDTADELSVVATARYRSPQDGAIKPWLVGRHEAVVEHPEYEEEHDEYGVCDDHGVLLGALLYHGRRVSKTEPTLHFASGCQQLPSNSSKLYSTGRN